MRAARLISALLLSVLTGASAVTAQVPGRWRLVLSPTPGVQVLGDLRLTDASGNLSGTLLLETSDSAPLAIAGRLLPEGRVEFGLADHPERRFEGRIIGEHMYGTAYLGRSDHGIGWLADRIDLEADFFVPLPRFTLHQLLISRDSATITLDGRWFSEMETEDLDVDFLLDSYRDATRAGEVPAANEPELRTIGYLQSMGLWRREEMVEGSATAFRQIRASIRDDTTRARFDFLFRPNGVWLTDIHTFALNRTQQKFPHVTWASVRPALQVPGVITQPVPPEVAMEPWLTYRLFVMSHTDSVRFHALLGDMRAVAQVATGSLERLLRGYQEAVEWYPLAMHFLLESPWFDGRSPADLVLARWPPHNAVDHPPPIVARLYGRPNGAPRSTPTDSLTALLVEPRNWTAEQWLARYGKARLLATLARLPAEIDHTVVQAGDQDWHLTSVRQLRLRPSGFLDPTDAVVLSPSYLPILALETVIHEWVHILHQRARALSDYARTEGDMIRLTPPDRFVAEGLAEWFAEVVLQPLIARVPLMAIGEAEKRASMAVANPNDPHLVGYLMFRLMARRGTDPDTVVWQAIRHGNDPNALLQLAASSRDPAGPATADRAFPEATSRYLIPEVTFEIDGVVPVVSARRVIPPSATTP